MRHSSLTLKLGSLDFPDQIYNWIINYYRDRGHITRFAEKVSGVAFINASVIQGSVIDPASFLVEASDLNSVYNFNKLVKYVDDSCLLVDSSHLNTATRE